MIALVLFGAACSDNDGEAASTAQTAALVPTLASVTEGAEISMPDRPSDIAPLVTACLAEAASVGPTLTFDEGCNEAALAADHAGLGDLAADLREMMTTSDAAARQVIIDRIERAIASL